MRFPVGRAAVAPPHLHVQPVLLLLLLLPLLLP
jgi:hypothetical protein